MYDVTVWRMRLPLVGTSAVLELCSCQKNGKIKRNILHLKKKKKKKPV